MAKHSPTSIIAEGKDLDQMAKFYGFKRKRYFWIFKESDRAFRERIVKWVNNVQKT